MSVANARPERIAQPNCEVATPARSDGNPSAKPARPSGIIGRIGWGAFIASMAAGFAAGALLVPVAGERVAGAFVAFGALCIVAATARRAAIAEAQVEELQQKLLDERSYHAFVDGAIEGFFRTTRDGKYLKANPALARIYGYESAEQLMRELTDISGSLYVDPKRREEFEALMAAQGMSHDFVSQIRRRDGSLIWIAENARRVTDEDDQFLFYEGTVEDVTAQREREDAVRQALRETKDAARAKAAFLAAMSHELKTPLNAVIGFSDLMLQEIFGAIEQPRYRGYIADIHENGHRLLTMINDILDLTRIEGRLLDLDETIVFVPDVLIAARDNALGDGRDAQSIVIDTQDNLPYLNADPKRLRQILAHLLSNAVKFTPGDGRIIIRAWCAEDGGMSIAIADSGIGMAPEMIQHALEPFKQLDGSLARRFEGAGLGLPLASALARLHDGRLSLESKPGEGTTATVHFPPVRSVAELRAASA